MSDCDAGNSLRKNVPFTVPIAQRNRRVRTRTSTVAPFQVDPLGDGRNGCEPIGNIGHEAGSVPPKLECKRRSKHDLYGTERIGAIGLLDLAVVLANGSGEVAVEKELKTFSINNVWREISTNTCTKLAEDPK